MLCRFSNAALVRDRVVCDRYNLLSQRPQTFLQLIDLWRLESEGDGSAREKSEIALTWSRISPRSSRARRLAVGVCDPRGFAAGERQRRTRWPCTILFQAKFVAGEFAEGNSAGGGAYV